MAVFGIISLGFLLAAWVVMFRLWPMEIAKTFSQNAARRRLSTVYYAAVMAVFLPLLGAFVYGELIPHLRVAVSFGWAIGIGIAAQAVAALVPETVGWRKVTHLVAASVMYLATVVAAGILVWGGTATLTTARVAELSASTLMLGVMLAGIVSARARLYALGLQMIHLLCFYTILFLSLKVGPA
jgi:hypothetical protein